MFGFGNPQQLLATREIEDYLTRYIGVVGDGQEVWIISPYVTMQKLGTLKRAIAEAAKRGSKISFVVRDEKEQVEPTIHDLQEACQYGAKLYAFERLHAKVYWFEDLGCILTSANLVDGSFEASMEIGLSIPTSKLHDEIREWIRQEIEPGLRPIRVDSRSVRGTHMRQNIVSSSAARSGSTNTSIAHNGGHCVRCGTEIPFNLRKPYCPDHYKSWAQYSNPDFTEKFCHRCGKPTQSTMAKPVCYGCYKQQVNV